MAKAEKRLKELDIYKAKGNWYGFRQDFNEKIEK